MIISEIFDRRAEFPLVFGGVATLFGVAAFVNGRVVERDGIDRVVTTVLTVMVPLNILLVVATLRESEPNFWVFMPTLGLILSGFMFLLPNLNSAAMEPVGHIAGTASSMTGAVRIAAGAALGTFISSQITDSVRPFAVGVAAMCGAAGLCVVAVRIATRRQRLMDAELALAGPTVRDDVVVADAHI